MRWKWWFSPRNPRFNYLLAGSCLANGSVIILDCALSGFWLLMPLGAVIILAGYFLVKAQRQREEREGSEWAAYQNREFDRMCDEAMRAIASRINDDLEKAGHGRPVHVQEVSIH